MVSHLLVPALGAFALRSRAVGDVLFQRALHARFPRVDALAVQVQAVDQVHHLVDRHAVAQHARDQLRIVPELLVEQTRNTADGVGVGVTVDVLEIVTFGAVGLAYLYYTALDRKSVV